MTDTRKADPAKFAEFVNTHAAKAGYNLTGPRSGGKKALAHDTGMSHASVCRMLNGQTIPAAASFEPLANALGIRVAHLFELAGIVSPGTLTGPEAPDPQPLTVREAADRLGIRNPLHVSVLEAVVTALRDEDGPP